MTFDRLEISFFCSVCLNLIVDDDDDVGVCVCLKGGAYRREVDRGDDKRAFREYRCSSEPGTLATYYLMACWVAVMLLVVLKYGNESQAAGELFKETKCIYTGSNVGTIFFIAFGVFIVFTKNYTLQIAMRGYGTLLTLGLLMYLLFAPKLQAVYFPVVTGEDGLTDTERDLAKQYQLQFSERNGKELLIILTNIIHELHHRVKRMSLVLLSLWK